jgi:hypothetical protein
MAESRAESGGRIQWEAAAVEARFEIRTAIAGQLLAEFAECLAGHVESMAEQPVAEPRAVANAGRAAAGAEPEAVVEVAQRAVLAVPQLAAEVARRAAVVVVPQLAVAVVVRVSQEERPVAFRPAACQKAARLPVSFPRGPEPIGLSKHRTVQAEYDQRRGRQIRHWPIERTRRLKAPCWPSAADEASS